MNKEQLQQYRALCLEIKELENRIQGLRRREVFDKVKASATEFPYNSYELKIFGLEDDKYVSRLKIRLLRRIKKCKNLRLDIEKFVDGIEDSRTRLVFQLRYIEGWTWQRISLKLGSGDESYSRKIHERFLKNT